MYKSSTVRDLMRAHAQELARRDEMIQSLLDRIQHPDRTPIWREPLTEPLEPSLTPEQRAWRELEAQYGPLVPDADQLPS